MSTTIRPELSEKNRYWLDRHRYYELKHFCLQYPNWKKAYLALDGFAKQSSNLSVFSNNKNVSDPTAKCAEAKIYYLKRMDLLAKVAAETDPELGHYIFEAVTNGFSYDVLKARLDVPCCKDVYYDLYRRFFWILSKMRE